MIGGKDNVVEQNEIIIRKDKTVVPKADVEQHALYNTTLEAGNDRVELYVVDYNESMEIPAFASVFGANGKQTYNGNYMIYLAEVDSDVAVLQDHLAIKEDKLTISISAISFQTFHLNMQTFLLLVQDSKADDYLMNMWTFADGELTDVTIDGKNEFIASTDIVKQIDNQYIQTYLFENNGWIFSTYIWNEKNSSFKTYYTAEYSDNAVQYGWQIGNYIAGVWHEHDLYYDSFPKLTFNKRTVELVQSGQLDETFYPLGTSIDQILKESPEFIEHDYYNGGRYYSFPGGVNYFYDEYSRETNAIMISGDLVKNDYSKLDSIFGTPIYDGYSEYSDSEAKGYVFGPYELRIEADKNTFKIRSVTYIDKG